MNSRAVLSDRGIKIYIGVDLLRVGKLSCYSSLKMWVAFSVANFIFLGSLGSFKGASLI